METEEEGHARAGCLPLCQAGGSWDETGGLFNWRWGLAGACRYRCEALSCLVAAWVGCVGFGWLAGWAEGLRLSDDASGPLLPERKRSPAQAHLVPRLILGSPPLGWYFGPTVFAVSEAERIHVDCKDIY